MSHRLAILQMKIVLRRGTESGQGSV